MNVWLSVALAGTVISVVLGVSAPFWPKRLWDSQRWQAICGGALLAFLVMWVAIQVWR